MDIKESTTISSEFNIEDDIYIAEITLHLNGEASWIEYKEHPKEGPCIAMGSEVTLPSLEVMEELGKRLIRYVNFYRASNLEDEGPI